MRKRVAIAGHSDNGFSLIPVLEANPELEIVAILTDDRDEACAALDRVGPGIREAYEERIRTDVGSALRDTGLSLIVEADPSDSIRVALEEAQGRGVQRTTPLVAMLLFAYGPVEGFRKPELLNTLGEILESYTLTIDRRRLLERVLQIAVGATGAERGSLMLYHAKEDCLRVEVAIGIEKEVLPKIRVAPGEGIAGRAFEEGRPLLLTGKADWRTYRITRERDDIKSALSVPLIHAGRTLGVLNLSHARERGIFTSEDLEFVEQLAELDARILARAEEYHTLQQDSVRLRMESEVRRILGTTGSLGQRLAEVCCLLAQEVCHGIAHLYLRDPELDMLVLQASSLESDPLASSLKLRPTEGAIGWCLRSGHSIVLSQRMEGVLASYAVLPLGPGDAGLGVVTVEGVDPRPDANDLVGESLDAGVGALARELRDLLRELRTEREAIRMGAITEAAARIASSKDSAELARTITSTAAMILESEHAVLRLQDEGSGRFQIRSYFGSADTESQEKVLALEKQLAIEAINQRATRRYAKIDENTMPGARELGIECAMVQPLIVGKHLLGTLSVLNNVARDPLLGERFGKDDERSLVRLSDHAAHAMGTILASERARERERFDETTGLPNAVHLHERLEQELARASALERPLALIEVRIVGLDEILPQGAKGERDRLEIALGEEFKAALRDFDIPARIGPEVFAALIPEPEGEIGEMLGPLARRLRETLAREALTSGEEPLPLEFGYAGFPEDGSTARALEERARVTRIRTV
ncbi:MAG: GAF domain-containing protein [Myxococcota bacterium]